MAKLDIKLPDFGKVVQDVTAEFKIRVERRTPRSNKDKAHLQDQWAVEQAGEGHQRIVNQFEYATFVENGTSRMAGAYMVRTTEEEVPQMIEDALKKQNF